MGVIKVIYPISDENIKQIKANQLNLEDFARANQSNSLSFDKFSADFYLMFSYTGNFTIGNIMESGSYVEDKQNYFLECRYLSPTKIKKISVWAKRVTPEKFKNFAVRYERIDNYGAKFTDENYQEYYDRYVKNFAEFVLKTFENGYGFLLVSM